MPLKCQWHCGESNDPEMVKAKPAQTEGCNRLSPFETVQDLTAKDIVTQVVEERHWSEVVVPSLSYLLPPLKSIPGVMRT
jgi:hypothetical protein